MPHRRTKKKRSRAQEPDDAMLAVRDNSSTLLVAGEADDAMAGVRDNSSTVGVGRQPEEDIGAVRDSSTILEQISILDEKSGEDGRESDKEEEEEEEEEFVLTIPYEDKRKRTVPQSHQELQEHIFAPSERRVGQSRHQPLNLYTPPCTRSMAPYHARDIVTPGVLTNELGYQKMYVGKYENKAEIEAWKNTDKLLKKLKKEQEKKKKEEEKMQTNKSRAATKTGKKKSPKKNSTKDRKKSHKRVKATPSRKAMAKKGYAK